VIVLLLYIREFHPALAVLFPSLTFPDYVWNLDLSFRA
jgi:hypothetical protein